MQRIMVLVGMAALMLMVLAPAALAVSPSQQECEAQGGTFERDRGTVTCVVVDEDPGKNPKFTETTTTEEESKGNLGENHPKYDRQSDTACDRPGSTEKCPPGQFKG